MYRTIGLYALRAGVDPKDNAAVTRCCPRSSCGWPPLTGEQHIYLNGEDVSTAIRTEDVGMAASAVGAIRRCAPFCWNCSAAWPDQNVLMDGRDIGTVVLPDATVKIFLTASAEARATPRWKEYSRKGPSLATGRAGRRPAAGLSGHPPRRRPAEAGRRCHAAGHLGPRL